jgi:hypothetical protein
MMMVPTVLMKSASPSLSRSFPQAKENVGHCLVSNVAVQAGGNVENKFAAYVCKQIWNWTIFFMNAFYRLSNDSPVSAFFPATVKKRGKDVQLTAIPVQQWAQN